VTEEGYPEVFTEGRVAAYLATSRSHISFYRPDEDTAS